MNDGDDEEINMINTYEPTTELRDALQQINPTRYSKKELTKSLSNFKKFIRISKLCPFLNQRYLDTILKELIFNKFNTVVVEDDENDEDTDADDDDDDEFRKLIMTKITNKLFVSNYDEEEDTEFEEEIFVPDDVDDEEICNDEIEEVEKSDVMNEPLCLQLDDLDMMHIMRWFERSKRTDTKRVFFIKIFRFCLVCFSRFDFSDQLPLLSGGSNYNSFRNSLDDCFHHMNEYPYSFEPFISDDNIIIYENKSDKSKDVQEIIFDNQLQQDFINIFVYPNGIKDKDKHDGNLSIEEIKYCLRNFPLLEQFAYICFPPYNKIDELVCFIKKRVVP